MFKGTFGIVWAGFRLSLFNLNLLSLIIHESSINYKINLFIFFLIK